MDEAVCWLAGATTMTRLGAGKHSVPAVVPVVY